MPSVASAKEDYEPWFCTAIKLRWRRTLVQNHFTELLSKRN